MKNDADHDIVRQVLDAIRSRRSIAEDLAEAANKFKHIDELRAEMRDEDIPYLLERARSSSVTAANLTLYLLRPFKDEDEVRALVWSIWSESTKYEKRMVVMWPLLDYEDLDASIHEEVYQFVRENLPRFIEDCNEWFGGPGEVLNSCRKRVNNRDFPSTKNWVYLCAAIGSADRDGLIGFLQEYQASTDEFTARVAKDMAEELANMRP